MSLERWLGVGLACAWVFLATSVHAADTIETGLVGSPNAAEWEMYVGIHKGFFAAAGIKLDIIYVPSASGVMQQLTAGSLDLVDTSTPGPINAVAHGAPVAIVRITEAVPPYDMVARTSIAAIKDLKGKTVVLGSLVNITHVYLERILKSAGLKDSDIDITFIGNTAGRFAALKSGSADAAMLAPPVNFIAEATGFHSIGTVMKYAGDLPFGSAAVSLAYAQQHRATLKRFLGALNKSIAWFNTDANRTDAIDILAAETSAASRDDVAKSYDYLRKIGFFPNDGAISRKRLTTLMNEMVAIGGIAGKVPLAKLVLHGIKVRD